MRNEETVNVKQLSNRRLWDLIRISELDSVSIHTNLINGVKEELINRNDFEQDKGWQLPH